MVSLAFAAAFAGAPLEEVDFFCDLVGDGDDFHLPGILAGEIESC